MRRWLRIAIWLYPAAWRRRYGREFDALLTDIQPRARDLWDIFRGAITVQLSTPVTYLKLGAATAALGALVASGVSFTFPDRYVSSAVMRVAPQIPTGADPGQYQMIADEHLAQLKVEVLSRQSLASLIQQPELNLYPADRLRYPLEDVIQGMRNNDIHIEPVETKLPFQDGTSAFRIAFEYPDRKVAQGVVRALVTRLNNDNVVAARRGPFVVNLEVLDPPNLPEKAIDPGRLAIVGIGLGAGFALGLLIAYLRRRPLRWTLWIAGSMVVGFVAFFAIAISLDLDDVPFGALGAAAAAGITAYIRRDREAWRPAPYLKSALAAAACCAIIVGLGSFLLPEHYVSHATLRAYQFSALGIPGPDVNGAVAERLHRLRFEIYSRNHLAEMIQRPSLNLYRHERERRPLEDVIQEMRSAVRVESSNPSRGIYTISFEYPDRFKAQAVVREVITKYMETNVTAERNAGREGRGQPGGINIEVLDPASDPQVAVSPNRLQFAALGFAAGFPVGLVIAFFRRRPRAQAVAMLRFASATGAAGAIVAAAISFAIPSRYISTATLRLRPAPGADAPDRIAAQQVHERMIEVLSRSSLADLIQRPELNLYRSERQRRRLEEIIVQMRDRDLRIESVDVGPPAGTTIAFSIAFEYSDPKIANAVVQSLVSKFVEGGVTPTSLEVLDPPSVPNMPVFPLRLPIAAGGGLLGLILGPIAEALRRRQPFPAAS
jgi:hypothetical protein